jgi:glycosyltransferase involved in cell wall biosynthesis
LNLLLLTQVVPFPPQSGPRIKTFNVLRALSRAHRVHLVSFVRSAEEVAHAEALAEYCSGITTVPLRRSRARDVGYFARSLTSGRPFLIERDASSSMRAVLAALVVDQRFDAIHADQLSMGQFALDLPLPLRVLDEHNAVWTIVQRAASRAPWYLRPAAALEWRKLRRYEGQVCRAFDRVTVVSTDDRLALEAAAAGSLTTTTIPIAVDTAELAFQPPEATARDVLSVATMFYPPNVEGVVWFGEHVLPRVRALVPDTRFVVVGSRPARAVSDLGRRVLGIEVTGYVDDLQPILRRSRVLVVPLHSGSGMRVKILEGFARGIPIVSTSVGVEGIDAQHDVHLLVADSPADFAAAVARLLREPETARRLALAGRALVERRYDWRTALGGLDDIYPADRLAA